MPPRHKEIMKPYVMKLPPSLLLAVKKAVKKERRNAAPWSPRITVSAFIRRAIKRDLTPSRSSRK